MKVHQQQYDHGIIKKLIILKGVIVCLFLLGLLFAEYVFEIQLGWRNLMHSFLLASAIFCISLAYLFKLNQKSVIRYWTPFFLVASDIVFMSLVIWQTGGSLNPFSSSVLIPLAVAAALLPLRLSLTLVIVSVAAYAGWTFTGDEHAHHHVSFELHLYGMWVNFAISAILVAMFIAYAMNQLQERETYLHQAREKILRDEQLVGIATLAASTAHSLGTPLSTMSILLEDVTRPEELSQSELSLLKEQILSCRTNLQTLANNAKQVDSDIQTVCLIAELEQRLKEHCNLLFPQHAVQFFFDEKLNNTYVTAKQSLFLALANLIDNAIQSSVKTVRVSMQLNGSGSGSVLSVFIEEDGPGIDKDIQPYLGQAFVTSKKEGVGVGFFLTNSTIEQLGGTIAIKPSELGGSLIEVSLPLEEA